MKKAGIVFIFAGLFMLTPVIVENFSAGKTNNKVILIRKNIRKDTGQGSMEGFSGVDKITANVIEELTLSEWLRKSYAGLWGPGMSQPFNDFNSRTDIVLVFKDKALYEQAGEVFSLKIPQNTEFSRAAGSFYIKLRGVSIENLKNMGMGLITPPKFRKQSGALYIRPVNDRWVNKEFIQKTFTDFKYEGVIFKGRQITGYPRYLDYLKELLEKKDPLIFTIEFAPQKGLKEISPGLRFARLHSIPQDLPPEDLQPRILRAVKERNIRAVYLKSEEHISETGNLNKFLTGRGYKIGAPLGFRIEHWIEKRIENQAGEKADILPVVGALISFAGLLIVLGARRNILIIFLISFTAVFFAASSYAVWLIAAGAAILFPYAAAGYTLKKESSFLNSLFIFIFCSATAGLIINSLYSAGSYYVKLNQVRGIKFMLIGPVAATAVLLFKVTRVKKYINGYLSRKEFILTFIFLFIAALYLIRSSNNFPDLVGNTEIKIRLFLEKIFIWRPLFK
nr:DUF5693 family protein [Elusimicrobiota bacterium]